MVWAYEIENIFEKIDWTRKNSNQLMSVDSKVLTPVLPARDVLVLDFKSHPEKKGFSTREGQARMLHDLASIELQAMELGVRTLVEFPEADQQFKEELLKLTLSEADHLEMCLTELESLGFEWGHWPINCGLWSCVNENDNLIDRILIVHRYLEGSGLDAGDILLRRLAGVDAGHVQRVVKIINDEEVGHVLFGAKWYQEFCLRAGLNLVDDFEIRMNKLRSVLPKRVGKLNHELRQRSGFSKKEIQYLEKLRESFLDKESPFKKL